MVHHVLENLTATELLRLRSVSTRFRHIAASNSYWRPCFHDLLSTFAAFSDIALIPPHVWSFSLAPDGWYRAYCALMRATREPWLQGEDDLFDSPWMVYFKQNLPSTDLLGVQVPHSIIRFTTERLAVGVAGVVLGPRKWWIQDGALRGFFLPPLLPPPVTAVLEEEGPNKR